MIHKIFKSSRQLKPRKPFMPKTNYSFGAVPQKNEVETIKEENNASPNTNEVISDVVVVEKIEETPNTVKANEIEKTEVNDELIIEETDEVVADTVDTQKNKRRRNKKTTTV